MNSRRLIAFVLSILMLLGTLVACAQTPGTPEETTPAPSDTNDPARTTTPAIFENTFKLRLSESSTESRMYDLIRESVTFDLCRFFNRQLSSMGSEWYKCATTGGSWASKSETLMKSVPALLQKVADSFNKINN